jgi:NitT/TauT family transport system substrate-binding protein
VRTLAFADAGYDVYTAIFCRRDFARDNPAATRAFLAATIRGWRDFMEGDPAPAFAEIQRRNPNMSSELLAFSRGEMIRHNLIAGDPAQGETIGRLSDARLREEINSLVALKLLEVPVAPGFVATKDYLPPEAK